MLDGVKTTTLLGDAIIPVAKATFKLIKNELPQELNDMKPILVILFKLWTELSNGSLKSLKLSSKSSSIDSSESYNLFSTAVKRN